MNANATITKLAQEARDAFYFTGEKPEGSTRPNIWLRRKEPKAADWITSLCRHAHEHLGFSPGPALPDDTRYEYIVDALDAIIESDGDEDRAAELLDEGVSVYNADLTAWVGSHGCRYAYVDEAREQGLVSGETDIIAQLSAGQMVERREVLRLVLESLQERADEVEDES